MYNHIGAKINGAAEVTAGTKGIVHDDGYALSVCYLDNGFKVWDIVFRVPDALNIYCLRFVVDELVKVLRLVPVDEFGADAKTWEEHFELVIGAAIEIRSADDIVSCMSKRCNSHELGGLSRRSCNSGNAALEGCNTFLKDIDCGLKNNVRRNVLN